MCTHFQCCSNCFFLSKSCLFNFCLMNNTRILHSYLVLHKYVCFKVMWIKKEQFVSTFNILYSTKFQLYLHPLLENVLLRHTIITRACNKLMMMVMWGGGSGVVRLLCDATAAILDSFFSLSSLTTSWMSMMSSWLSRKSLGGRLGPLHVSRPHRHTVALIMLY